MRKLLLFLAIALVAVSAAAQTRVPRPSPKSTLTQAVGNTDITITYSRPGVKGRTIWGGLVPYDQVWRTGANEATTIAFSDDVTINGQKLAKGTYSLHTIPSSGDWTFIFNSVADQWGSYSYDAAKDVIRVKATPAAAPHAEWMMFEVPELSTDKATVVLRWEKLAVPFTVDTGTTAKVMSQLKSALNPDWRAPYLAASFAFDNKGAATDAEMNQWIDSSLKIAQNTNNLWLKARIAERAGNKADAVKYGEQAVAAATPAQAVLAGEIKKNVDKWKQ